LKKEATWKKERDKEKKAEKTIENIEKNDNIQMH
jgi:hypothetical protein